MKKLTVYDLFLICAALMAFASNRSIYASIMLCAASILELMDTVPKIARCLKNAKR